MSFAPGRVQGPLRPESALDSCPTTLGIDPIEAAAANCAEVHPESGSRGRDKAMRECYAVGAERFVGAAYTRDRNRWRDGNWLSVTA